MTKLLKVSMIRNFIPPRKFASRKGDNGKVLVLGGSYIYHGAPILSSIAALRCGTDLVYTCVPKINAPATRATTPNLIVLPLVDAKLTRGAVHKLLGIIPRSLCTAPRVSFASTSGKTIRFGVAARVTPALIFGTHV